MAKLWAVALTGSDQAVRAVPSGYGGFSIRETSGTATATVVIYDDDAAATGTPLEQIQLLPGESAREYYRDTIQATVGIYVDVVSGAVAGSVRVG